MPREALRVVAVGPRHDVGRAQQPALAYACKRANGPPVVHLHTQTETWNAEARR